MKIMADQQDKPEVRLSSSRNVKKELPLDTRMLSDAVIELNISRKNVGIYPPGHIQITKSIDRAFEVLLKIFDIRQDMTFGIAKDTLFVGKDYLDRSNPVYRDFALSLSGQGIAAVTFRKGIDRPELERFHRILTTRPEDITKMGGIAKVVANAGMPNIQVIAVDYGSLHVTEEQELSHAHAEAAEEQGPGLWGDFVSHLSSDIIAVPGRDEGVSLKDAEQIDPAELARLLNERKLDPGMAIQSYDRIISSHLRVRSEQRQLSRGQSEALRSLNSLLKDLNPDLRRQFLAVTFDRTADASPALTEEVIGGLADEIVVEMLQQANAEGREISPTLTGLLSKLSSASSQAAEQAPGGAGADRAPQATMTQEQVQSLLRREQYETYVSDEYEDTLRRLGSGKATVAVAAGTFPIDEYVASMSEEKLDYQIGRVLLGFIDEEIEDDDYGEFLKKIMSNLSDLVRTGQFALLHDTFETLRLHSREKRSLSIRAMVDNALRGFRSPAFISSVCGAFSICRDKERARAAGRFLLALGTDAVPLIFDLYACEEAAGGKRAVFDLLCDIGHPAVQEAVRRLGDPRPYYVRNLLMLIRWGWDGSVTPSLRPLLRHADQKVRHEAIAALLRFRDPAAVPVLRAVILSQDPDESAQAVSLAAKFRVSGVVDALLSRLKKVILFESDYGDNEEIIRALGEIGDPRAMPDMERLARGAWPLFPKSRARMRATIFESLSRFPREAIDGLLSFGEQSDDPRVLRTCQKLRKERGHA
jgi:HEAT repeat protein